MSGSPLFLLPDGLKITSVSETPEAVLVRVTSYRTTSCCPLCSTLSSAIHSYYRRRPLDLPCAGRPIRLLLTVKKFFCRNASCQRKIFTERLPELIEASSRLTKRLRSTIQEIGFATGGKGGERLSSRLGIRISDTTLLWSLSLVPLPPIGKVTAIGIDDWSYRRGKRYGSIIVDLRTHKIIDLLPERSVESVIAWLEAHPEVEVVSRDRGGTYVDGVTQGAPLAIQVCDRWHLLKNLGEAVEAFLIRAHIRLPEKHVPQPTQERPLTTYSATLAQQGRTQARLLRKWKHYERIQELHADGMSLRKIGEELGLARNTVRKYFRQPPEPPLPTPRPLRASKLDRYEDYILTRLSQGCKNAAQIYREITEMGFKGGHTNVRAYVAHLRKSTAEGSTPAKRSERAQAISPRTLRWLLTRDRTDLNQEEQAHLDQLLQISPEVQLIHTLLHAFLDMVRERQYQQLRPWMQEASKSAIPEIKSFVAGIERDYDAVKEALRLPWSQGITEGKVNKLKTIKRQMYGRAGFPLLRQRLLHAA
ncbi:MAG TPA: ISL3 family transposase [Ktedonobacteraceae bacterium]|jgi:transposase